MEIVYNGKNEEPFLYRRCSDKDEYAASKCLSDVDRKTEYGNDRIQIVNKAEDLHKKRMTMEKLFFNRRMFQEKRTETGTTVRSCTFWLNLAIFSLLISRHFASYRLW